ncbi:hypothetical protein EGW08_003105 [Elysia chlorotica]|uniref:Tetraspanin n=1 Tax=Elysia chlorotica TaxID=188477 RepID=A0A433U5J6_ELYCH|nr:hypothetical protein EGW08_003105 [Elysia chlorotica]
MVRFNQASFLNSYLQDLEDTPAAAACQAVPGATNPCLTQTEFDTVDVGDWPNNLGALIIVSGFIIMLYSGAGAVGATQNSQPALLVMFTLILVSMGLEYFLLDICLGGDNMFHENAKEELSEKLASEYTLDAESNAFSRILNSVMIKSQCCGIQGPNDFSVNETLTIAGETHNIMIPPACCEVQEFSTPREGVNALLECSRDTWAKHTYQLGCYSVLHMHFYDKYGKVAIALIVYLVLLEGTQELFIFLIIFKPYDKSNRSSRKSSRGSQSSARNSKRNSQNIFVPFSRISNMGSDAKRASTEIW